MQGIIFALLSYVGWGSGDIFGTFASRKIGSGSTTLWASIIAVTCLTCYAPFQLHELSHYTLTLIMFNIGLGVLGTLGNIFLNEGFRVDNPGLVGTISASFTAVTVICSILFLHERITSFEAFIVILIFIGVFLSSFNLRDIWNRKNVFNYGVVLALITSLCWGIMFTGTKAIAPTVGWFWPLYINGFLFPVTILYMKLRKEKFRAPKSIGIFSLIFANTFLLRLGDFSFNFGLHVGQSAIVGPIAGSYPTLFVPLSFLVFREKVSRQQVFGIIITLVAIVILSFSGA